mmetsp:Transcript_14136/g.45272  ORF Transcript_14136/g.45272 Transcript_14136/m.45272 type:complete len:248 (+) Transcript_14136:516-1259(+)
MPTTPLMTRPLTTRPPTTARPMSRLRRCRPVSRSCGQPACPPHPPPPGARMPPVRVAGTSSSGDARAPGGLPQSPTRRAAPGRALSRRRKLLLRAQRRTPAWLCSPRSRCLSQRPATPPAPLLPLRWPWLSGRPPLPTARRSGGDARRRQRGRSSSPRGTGPTGRARTTRPAPPPARGVSASRLTRRCPRCRGPMPLLPPPTTPPQQRRRWRRPPRRRSCRQRRPSPLSQRWRLALRRREQAAAAPV